MSLDEFILATLPPALAMLVERFNPVNERSLRKSVDDVFNVFEGYASFADVKNFSAGLAAGAVETSGLAPTFVAALTAGFAILQTAGFWPLVVYVLILLVPALWAIRIVLSMDYLALATMPAFPKTRLSILRGRGVDVVGRMIYAINLLIILTAFAAFLLGRHERSAMQHEPTPKQESHEKATP